VASFEEPEEFEDERRAENRRLWRRLAFKGAQLTVATLGTIGGMSVYAAHASFRAHDFFIAVVNGYRSRAYPRYDLVCSIFFPHVHLSSEWKDMISIFILTSTATWIESRDRDKLNPVTGAYRVIRGAFGDRDLPLFDRRNDPASKLYAPLQRFLSISFDPATLAAFAISLGLIALAVWHFRVFFISVPLWAYATVAVATTFAVVAGPSETLGSALNWLGSYRRSRALRILRIALVAALVVSAIPLFALWCLLLVVYLATMAALFMTYLAVYVVASPIVAWRTTSASVFLFVLVLFLNWLAERGVF
jgi:hypothetical protein